jgi:UDP-glucuronate decarboxylase
MKKVLITGAAGFIGSHLCERMLNCGWQVIALDNLYSGRLSNIEKYKDNPNFSFINHDVTSYIFIPVDLIINLACPASPVYYQKDPVSTIRTNVLGAVNMLELARALDCPIFQASTSEVYGDPLVSPQSEDYLGNVNPIGIRACYDEGKRVAETLFSDYRRQYGVKTRIVRIFNTYGPRMRIDDGRVVTNFIQQALANEDITIYGDGKQSRSFCYISDLIEALMSYVDLQGDFEGPINLGNPQEFTMLELASLVIELTSSKSDLQYLDLPQDDPKQRKPDIKLASEILNWTPKISLQDGLKAMLADRN